MHTLPHTYPDLAKLGHAYSSPSFFSVLLNGPSSDTDYALLDSFFSDVASKRAAGVLDIEQVKDLQKALFNDSFSTPKTLQGHVQSCPRGYYGDFEIIDKIYTNYLAPELPYRNWDTYFQSKSMPQAVRNRKAYFIKKLTELPEGAKVLNLASGPCRDLLEFDQTYGKHLVIDCVDLDQDAISSAKSLLGNTQKLEVRFTHANILRFLPSEKYDLIWSAGLFDYFDNPSFTRIISRFAEFVQTGGKMIIGNFRVDETTVAYMEFGGWYLHYRTEEDLLRLSQDLPYSSRSVEQEPLGLNLFLNITF